METSSNFPLSIQITSDTTTGYAAVQNNIPVVRGILIKNTKDEPIRDIELTLSASPAFFHGFRQVFDHLAAGETRVLSTVDLTIDHDYLVKLDEAEIATLTVDIVCSGELVGRASQKIEVLAYDQWAGTRSLPELLAAFVMPNDRIVDRLLGKAASLLRMDAGITNLDGYQSKQRENVWKQVSAIYSAIAAEDIHYANPPASFGTDGQKIRTPERIFDGRLATCLDLTLLFASCLEQAGLHPVVLFKEGHAWIGVWFTPTRFANTIVDDVQMVRKRVKSGEFCAFETTGIASGVQPSLRWACSRAEEYLEDGGRFLYAVDIHRAREYQIRAIPSRSQAELVTPVMPGGVPPAVEDMPALPPLDPELVPENEPVGGDTPESRLANWKSKLLDLTLRNRLLNFKPAKTHLRLLCSDLAALEDHLSEGKDFRLRAPPSLMDGKDPREAAVYLNRTGQTPLDTFTEEALQRREIVVDSTAEKLDDILAEIFRLGETSKEEGGANTLFLALGMLQWREDPRAEGSHRAPILLIPVTLSRPSVRSGFKLARHDDDALVNPTLIQKLLLDFQLKLPAFDVLPTDERGIDVEKVFQAFRLQIAELEGWEVKEESYLGNFSFTKYLMWKDLNDRQDQLQANPVVAHLIQHPGEAFSDGQIGYPPDTLDNTFQPQDLHTPMLADSSQLRAIIVASKGSHLVLEGPPGTGKSQTIANLIAHLLGIGKSVLFVSEKTAALEVVHRRLTQIGLGPFCLELHSAKANKTAVIAQLEASLQASGSRTVEEWEREATRLAGLRQELNETVAALHRVHDNGLTLYEAIGTSIEGNGCWPPAAFVWTNPDQHNRDDLEALRTLVRQMAALAGQLSDLAGHPLRIVRQVQWTPSWQQSLLHAADELARAIETVQSLLVPLLHLVGFDGKAVSWSELGLIDQLADVLLGAPSVPAGVARAALNETARTRLDLARKHGQARQTHWSALQGGYRDELTQLNAASLEASWGQAQACWWPKRWFTSRSILKQLGQYTTDGRPPLEKDVPALLETLKRLNKEDRVLELLQAEILPLLEEAYAAAKTDWAAVEQHERWAKHYADCLTHLSEGDLAQTASLNAKLQPYLVDNRSMLRQDGIFGQSLLAYRNAYRELAGHLARVAELAGPNVSLIEDPRAGGAIPRILADLQGWHLAQREIQPWCLWQNNRGRALAAGLEDVVRAVETGVVPLCDLEAFFEFSYRHWWLQKAMDREPVLCAFSSADQERKIEEFRAADARFQVLTQHYVVAKLAGHIPAQSVVEPGADSEMGRLRREIRKQRKHLPIRQLIQGLPSLLPRLKPCLMMSPLSVAQYLDAGHPPFDVVVFDEASQISIWDAVGAIARGRQLVCVGDPKQLPPTRFFQRSDEGEDELGNEDVVELESILDECLSIGLPTLGLDWHYRSRHESLIAFSNATYYGNRLITFPSPVTEDRAVRLERVNGAYDRGGSRTNPAEAQAIVQAIERHYLDPETRTRSLGVVTFNQSQQHLIEKLVDGRRRVSAALDQAIASAQREPLFIKNLESVQGDERDMIYFSITYGPDAAGKMTLNFGPLNTEGGQKRLNVAVTRARHGVVIFSTMLPEHIDLARVRAAGVQDLKHYLEFALRGPRALVEQALPTGREPDSPFERQVIQALRDNGWSAHPQVGVSGYLIDIGIVDPRAPGRYLLGVECDGATYHSGATARDRDRLRQLILEDLGWTLHRIWSTDWWRNPNRTLQTLLDRLESMVSTPLEPVHEVTEHELPSFEDEVIQTEPATPVFAEAVRAFDTPPTVSPKTVWTPPTYQPYPVAGGQSALFYEPAATSTLINQVRAIIDAEGPIADFVLYRRIARAWGFARTGQRIENRLSNMYDSLSVRTQDGDTTFFWPTSVDPNQWTGFRVADESDESRRALDEITPQELANMAIYVLSEHGSTSISELVKAVSRMCGLARTPLDARTRILLSLQKHGDQVVYDDERVQKRLSV